jgi:hypothetical protein
MASTEEIKKSMDSRRAITEPVLEYLTDR